ncbi:MAG: hypothetical protein R3325_03770 [Thermoanaerobaculia bacterium]|nr:hypothetical protein [Thermoanaerobaculia bacterium]
MPRLPSTLLLLLAAAAAAAPQFPAPSGAAPEPAPVEEVRPWIERGDRPAWAPKGDRIAFDRPDELGISRLWIAEPDGSAARCLTCRPLDFEKLHAGNATWHPSGEYLVFQVERPARRDDRPLPFRAVPGGNRGQEDLWAITTDGRTYWNITHRGDEGYRFAVPHFSREGDRLLWGERVASGGGAWGRWTLRVAEFALTRGVPRLRKAQEHEPGPQRLYKEPGGFTADDRGLLFAANLEVGQPETGLDVYEMRMEDGTVRRLTHTLDELDRHPRFSPNGRWIAWVSNRGVPPARDEERWLRRGMPALLATDLWLMAADGSGVARLTHFSDVFSPDYAGRMMVGPPAWSPEGDRLLVPVAPQDAPHQAEIYLVRLTTPLGR